MIVGNYATILADTENKVGFSPFTPYYQAMGKVLILHTEVQYTWQYTENLYILMFSNSLSVPIIHNKLIMLFIMIESGLVVKDIAKLHAMDPYVEDHSIYFTNFYIRITLFLHRVFSYFLKSKP